MVNNNKYKKFLKISVYFFKNTFFYKSLKQVTTPSKKFTITFKSLYILSNSINETILLLETSKGIITHKEALKAKIGGNLLIILN